MINWERVRAIMVKSVRGEGFGSLHENYLYKALALDPKRYRKLHAEVKAEADKEVAGAWTKG